MVSSNTLIKQFNQFNNSVPLGNILEGQAAVPIYSKNLGGNYGALLTQLSIGYGPFFQKNAFLKIEITGISIDPSGFQAVSATFNTFNVLAQGDEWELPPNATLNIYAYNHGAGADPELFDIIATAKQYTS